MVCSDGETGISMEYVLIFFTGARSVPVLGWSTQPELFFHPTNVYPIPQRVHYTLYLYLYFHPSTTTTMKNLSVSWYKVFETTEVLT